MAGDVNKEEQKISLEKLVTLIERKQRTSLVMRGILICDETEMEKSKAQ